MTRTVTSEVRCDRHGCTNTVTVSHDVDESRLHACVVALGWQAKKGTSTTTHHCPVHREVT